METSLDTTTAFERLAAKANRIATFKSPKRQYTAMLKLYPEWREASRDFLFGRVTGEEILAAYTKLDYISETFDKQEHADADALSMTNYFAEFAETLDTHTDRMFFNSWIRCQLCFQNALEHGSCAFVKNKED